jgi:transposase
MSKPKKKPRTKTRKKKPSPKRQEVKLEELEKILARTEFGPLSEEDRGKLGGAVDTLAFLTQELEKKGTSIKRLRKLIFGASTEKTSQVVGETAVDAGDKADDASSNSGGAAASDGANVAGKDAQDKPKRKGHGKNGAADYQGAEKVSVDHESLKRGDPCPKCPKGKLYPMNKPAVLVRVTGMAPLQAIVAEMQRLRCNLCGLVFTARPPEGMDGPKYDETAASMIAMLKYGTGMPFNRLERLQRSLGIPLPASTQWDVVQAAAGNVAPAYAEIIRQAAQGDVLHNDDTTMKILELMGLRREKALAAGKLENEERTGIFTSGILSTTQDHRIAVFFTGTQHAGENLADVLAKRAEELAPPIQMSDALSRNTPGAFKTLVANCNAHARRRFVDVVDSFPDEVRHVLEELRTVYKNDAIARKQQMSPEERLHLHQAESGPVMKELKTWLKAQIDEHKVEPNSGLGEAIGYMLKHWEKLTLFLRVPGAPLDNNVVERALKRAIQHRKNALFYRSENGARVGDTFMTLIYSAELNDVDPFDYLVALQHHADEVAASPGDWLPWSYRETLKQLTTGAKASAMES